MTRPSTANNKMYGHETVAMAGEVHPNAPGGSNKLGQVENGIKRLALS